MSYPTYAGTIDWYRFEYHQQLELQRIAPFVVPADILGYVLLIAYLMLRQKLSDASRIPVLSAIVITSIYNLRTSRTLGLAYGILIGISSAWCIALSVNLMFLLEPEKQYKRLISCSGSPKYKECPKRNIDRTTQGQSMPLSSYARLFWILDLLGSLRALHWYHGHTQAPEIATSGKKHPENCPSFGRNLGKLLLIYLCIDCLKEIIAIDPYFWGYTDYEPPGSIRTYLSSKLSLPSIDSVRTYRMIVAFAVLYVAVELISTVGVLLFVNILGPSLAGTWGEEWAYSPQYGDLEAICTRGLQGFWGTWWHQMFRSTLVSPTDAVINILQVPRKGVIARVIRLVIAFSISGAIHAAGSHTMWGNTKPLNSFLFFFLQPAGIAVQILGSWGLSKLNPRIKVSTHSRKAVNVLFTIFWLLHTFPLLADDFARGGLWLTEPFPISVLQMLGLGSASRARQIGFDYGLHVSPGRRWWQVGLAL